MEKKQRQTKIDGDFVKSGKRVCSKSGGGAAGPAGWTGSNKTLLQHEACIASKRFNEQFLLALQVEKLYFKSCRKRTPKQPQTWLAFSV